VLAEILLDTPRSEPLRQRLAADPDHAAPHLLDAEVLSVIERAHRTGEIDGRCPDRTCAAARAGRVVCDETRDMQLHVDIITLAVPDLEVAHHYYVEGLGWEPALVVPGEVTFLRAGTGRMVALFARADLAADIGSGDAPAFDLGHLCEDEAGVDEVVAALVDAGGTIRKPPRRADWGGYHAYVEAPDGTVWEIAHNPGWSIDADGNARIGS
jgi:uncharacterized protein